MKFLVVFVCVLAMAYGIPPALLDAMKERIKISGGECKKEVGASDDEIAPIKTNKPPTTHNAKCFLSCMQKKFGFQDQSGKINKDGAYAMIDKIKAMDEELYGKLKQIADNCLAKVTDDADQCETAAKLFACVHKENAVVKIEALDMDW